MKLQGQIGLWVRGGQPPASGLDEGYPCDLSSPQPPTHLICGAAIRPESTVPRSRPAAPLLSGGSPRPLPPEKPECDPTACREGWRDGASKEGAA